MSKVLKTDGMNKCIGCFTCMLACSGVNRQNHSISKSAIKVRTSGGLKGKFVADVCIACNDERACVEACIVSAVFFDDIVGKPIICKHCGVCTRFCPHECLRMEEQDNDI